MSEPSIGHNSEAADAPATRFAKEQLKAIVERIERLEEEKKTISDDIRDVYVEAKGNGFDVKTLRKVVRLLGALDGPAYNLILHTAPLHERVDETYHWHWEIHPRLREIAGLEIGTGLPVNPVSPEDAVDELLRRADAPAEAVG